MYIDTISYQLADGVGEEQLLEVAQKVIDSWMSGLDGFVSWSINKTETGYRDLVVWQSQDDAKRAEQKMADIPPELSQQWFGCYQMDTITSQAMLEITRFDV